MGGSEELIATVLSEVAIAAFMTELGTLLAPFERR